MMPQTPKQDIQLLEAALIGYQHQRDELEQKIADLQRQIGGHPVSRDGAQRGTRMKRQLSAAARQRIAQAQKKRWAAYKAQRGKTAASKPKKRVLSAAGRARIVAATKKRWAAFRKAKEGK